MFFKVNERKADPYFLKLECLPGLYCVVRAESKDAVIKQNNIYADGKGQLTRADVAEIIGAAAEKLKQKGYKA